MPGVCPPASIAVMPGATPPSSSTKVKRSRNGTTCVCTSLPTRSVGPLALSIGDQKRSEEHTSELQSLMRISYAVFCLKKKKKNNTMIDDNHTKLEQISD